MDTDLYKFTTSYVYIKLFPRACGEFVFVDRSNGDYPDGFDERVRQELEKMAIEKALKLKENRLAQETLGL